MTKFRYEVHRVVTKKSGPFEIEADTWLEARVAVMKQFEDISSENLTIKLNCKNPFAGTMADPGYTNISTKTVNGIEHELVDTDDN